MANTSSSIASSRVGSLYRSLVNIMGILPMMSEIVHILTVCLNSSKNKITMKAALVVMVVIEVAEVANIIKVVKVHQFL